MCMSTLWSIILLLSQNHLIKKATGLTGFLFSFSLFFLVWILVNRWHQVPRERPVRASSPSIWSTRPARTYQRRTHVSTGWIYRPTRPTRRCKRNWRKPSKKRAASPSNDSFFRLLSISIESWPKKNKKYFGQDLTLPLPIPPPFSYPVAIRKETAGDSARNYGDGFLAQRLNPPLFLRLVLFLVHTPTKPYLTLFTFPIPFRCPQHAKILKRNPFDWTFLKKKKKNKTGKRIVLALPPGVYICQCRATTTTTTTPPHQKIFV